MLGLLVSASPLRSRSVARSMLVVVVATSVALAVVSVAAYSPKKCLTPEIRNGPRPVTVWIASVRVVPAAATAPAYNLQGLAIPFTLCLKQPGTGRVEIRGPVMVGWELREAAKAAVDTARRLMLSPTPNVDFVFEIDMPDGLYAADGASASGPLTVLVLAGLLAKPLRDDVMLLARLGADGHLVPVANLREKIAAAWRAGVTTILIPQTPEDDLPAAIAQARLIEVQSMQEAFVYMLRER